MSEWDSWLEQFRSLGMGACNKDFLRLTKGCDVLSRILNTVEAAVELEEAALGQEVEAARAKGGVPDHEAEWLNDRGIHLAVDVPQAVRAGLFVAALTHLETWLSTRFNAVKPSTETRRMKQFCSKGSTLEAAKTAFKSLGIPFPADGSEWEEVMRLQKIRNAIVHRAGEVGSGDDDRDLRNAIEKTKTKGFSLKDYRIDLETEAVEGALDAVEALMDRVIDALPDHAT
ncbi:MAG: hypothetical protein AB7N76_05235 [Planctomycetota bacterium]